MAYLSMMAVRLLELHRVLKPTGSLYLHCDPTAGHNLKLLLDSIFGPDRFLNEIIWKRPDFEASRSDIAVRPRLHHPRGIDRAAANRSGQGGILRDDLRQVS
jgi:site-specific DNA-methyltransferase (adenine-specific)